MFGLGKKQWTASEIATAFLNAALDEDGYYEGFQEFVWKTTKSLGGPIESFQQAFRDAPFPQMAYMGAVLSTSMLAIQNLFPDSAAHIYRQIYEKVRELCSEETSWFPDYMFLGGGSKTTRQR